MSATYIVATLCLFRMVPCAHLVTGVHLWATLRSSAVFGLYDQNEGCTQVTAAGLRQLVPRRSRPGRLWSNLGRPDSALNELSSVPWQKEIGWIFMQLLQSLPKLKFASAVFGVSSVEGTSWIAYSFSQLFCVLIILSVFNILGDTSNPKPVFEKNPFF